MCSGAKEDMLAMSALMSALMTTGSSQVAPPCTTRCPTTSISWAEAMTLVSPYQRVPSKHSTTCFREQPWKLFLCTVPAEFFVSTYALSVRHSTLPSHNEVGG